MTTQYQIHLDGVSAWDLSLSLFRDLVDLLVEGASRAARLAAEGRSSARGAAPVWLSESSDIRMVGVREGSLALDVTARPLAEVAPSVFTADTPVLAGETSVDLLLRAVDDALHGRRDSELLDHGMLQTLAKSKALFQRGATRLRFSRRTGAALELTESAIPTFQKLASETPSPKVERVVGVLDSLTMSTRAALLRLADGTALKGDVAASVDLEHVKAFLGRAVLVEGMVAFRLSGRPHRVEIDHVVLATERDQLWSRTPRGEMGAQRLSPLESLAPLFGQWPGDEDDETVFAALRDMS